MSKIHLKPDPLLLGGVAICLLVIVSAVQFFKNPEQASAAINFKTEDITNKDDALAAYISQHGAKETVLTLSQLGANGSFDCHQRAHTAGRLGYKILGAEKAFKEGSGECHSGWFHGTTEAYFADQGTKNLAANLSKLCTSELNGFFKHQCFHGVGHGLMGWSNYEIADALAACDSLNDLNGQGSCATGVFMENYTGAFAKGQTQSADHVSKYLSNDPQYPCNVVAEKYKSQCYFLQTSRMLQIFNGDFKKVVETCNQVPGNYISTCFASMGRDVGGATRNNPEESISKCSLVTDEGNRLQCLGGAIQDYFWDPESADAAIAFCRVLKIESEKQLCYLTITSRANDIIAKQDFDNFCHKLEVNYQPQCKKITNPS